MAIEAVLHENYVNYLTTLTIVNAIIAVGNNIAATLGEGGASGGGKSGEAFSKTLGELREALMPGDKSRAKQKVAKIKRLLEQEAAGGPMKVRVMSPGKNRKTGKRKSKGSMRQ